MDQPEKGPGGQPGVSQAHILLAASVWWPLSARLALRFLDYGCRVSSICPHGHILRHVHGQKSIYTYRGVNSQASLEQAIRRAAPDLILPCDDRVVWQLHELHATRPDLRAVIEKSLGSATGFSCIRSRDQLLDTAKELGIRIPVTQRISSEQEIHAWFAAGARSAVLKLDGSWGGEGVAVVHSEEEAIRTFRELSRPAGPGTAVKRYLVNRDPLSFWSWRRAGKPAMVLQQFITGYPANSMLASWNGETLAVVSVRVLATLGATGAAFLVQPTHMEEMTQAARLLTAKLQLSGYCGLDFVIEAATGLCYLIEMNPRCTQLGHLTFSPGKDLAGALCERATGQACVSRAPAIDDQVVAFFPQALPWIAKHPDHPLYLDTPLEQPQLAGELQRASYPERQWPALVYHWMRPQQKVEPVEYSAGTRPVPASPPTVPAGDAVAAAPGNAQRGLRLVQKNDPLIRS
jgi:hypothetical protein